MNGDKDRLADILEGIARVEKYAFSGKEAFLRDELIQTWIVHNIQIVGEVAGKLSRDFRTLHSEVPWPQIAAEKVGCASFWAGRMPALLCTFNNLHSSGVGILPAPRLFQQPARSPECEHHCS
jgi:hypothetical protein